MSGRDELATIIHRRICEDSLSECLEDGGYCVKAASELLAAGYRKPRTITTTEGLEALPGEAVLRNSKGRICEVWTLELGDGPSVMVYSAPGNPEDWPVDRIALPAVVLWEPTA